VNEVKKSIALRLNAEQWPASDKAEIAKQAEFVMERAISLVADKGKLPVNGNLSPVLHIVTNELITNIADDPQNAIHLVTGVARRISVLNGKCESEQPHHAKATKRGESGATRA